MKLTKQGLIEMLVKSSAAYDTRLTTYGSKVIVFGLNEPEIFKFDSTGKFLGKQK